MFCPPIGRGTTSSRGKESVEQQQEETRNFPPQTTVSMAMMDTYFFSTIKRLFSTNERFRNIRIPRVERFTNYYTSWGSGDQIYVC